MIAANDPERESEYQILRLMGLKLRDQPAFAWGDVPLLLAGEGDGRLTRVVEIAGMTRRGVIGLATGSAAMLGLASCGLFRPSEELRYRLTVEVETPQGLRTGSSVIEVRGVKNPGWVNPEGRGTRTSFRGEAAAIDLPGGKTLFALLKSEGGVSNAADYPYLAFRNRLRDSRDWLDSMRRLRDWEGDVAPMPTTETAMGNGGTIVSALPLLVTFGDVADPKSVARVDPGSLETALGAGVRLRRITVAVTDDAVTTGIEKRLRWLPNFRSIMLNGDRIEWFKKPELAAHLAAGSFQAI